jgi:uncharacterized membrane protein YqhA
MLRNILGASRYVILIPVIGTFLASIAALVYGVLAAVNIILEAFAHAPFTPDGAKHLEIECIEVIDLFLLGTVLYIIALGLYELFIDDRLPMPHWLVISNLDNLKEKLIGVTVVLLAVTFLGNVVTWDLNSANGANILALGIATGLVLFALGYLLSQSFKNNEAAHIKDTKDEQKQEEECTTQQYENPT